MALATRLFWSVALILDKFPGVSPAIIECSLDPFIPPSGKMFRLVAPTNVLLRGRLFAAEILIRGMAAMTWSSLMVLPTDFLKELSCMLRARDIISVTRDLLASSAFKASVLFANSLRPQLIPCLVKSIFLSACLPSGSSLESIYCKICKSVICLARFFIASALFMSLKSAILALFIRIVCQVWLKMCDNLCAPVELNDGSIYLL